MGGRIEFAAEVRFALGTRNDDRRPVLSLVADVAAQLSTALASLDAAEAERERYSEALQRIVQWADAYPLSVFPEPNFRLAREALQAVGITLDSISASNMRHVVTGVGKIARAALATGEGK